MKSYVARRDVRDSDVRGISGRDSDVRSVMWQAVDGRPEAALTPAGPLPPLCCARPAEARVARRSSQMTAGARWAPGNGGYIE